MQTSRTPTPVERLRDEILISGVIDWVSMAEIHQIIRSYQLAAGGVETQRLVLTTIRGLLEDGLVELGELPGRDQPFPAWKPIDTAVARLRSRYVEHYDDPESWDYSIWLGSTPAGIAAGKTMLDGNGRVLVEFRPYEQVILDTNRYSNLGIPKGVTVTIVGYLGEDVYTTTVSNAELHRHGAPPVGLNHAELRPPTTGYGNADFTVGGHDLKSRWGIADISDEQG